MNLPVLKLPTFLQIEPVGQCNLRCQMCPIQFRRDGPPHGPPAFMDFERFVRLLDEFVNLEELHLQGLGEPMMHPRFFDMVELATKRGIRVTTNTNMTLLNPARAARCVTSGLAEIHASIDGATPQTYERIRVRAYFDRVLANLQALNDAKAHFTTDTPRVCMIVVIMRQNLHELADLVRLAARFEIPSIFVQHLCHDFGEATLPEAYRPMRDFVNEQTLLHEEKAVVQQHFDAAKAAAAELGIKLRLPSLSLQQHAPHTPGPERCDWPWRGAYVSYQGLAMPCCMVATPDRIHFGNMSDAGANAVWNGPEYAAFRAQLSSATPPGVCTSCSIYSGTF